MRVVFADTHYFLALLNEDDASHAKAVAFPAQSWSRLVTTAWVIVELADAFGGATSRTQTVAFVDALKASPNVVIIPPTEELLDRAWALYRSRLDKDWSLTDCTSFVVMTDHGIRDALTGDRHFEQAGFRALLR